FSERETRSSECKPPHALETVRADFLMVEHTRGRAILIAFRRQSAGYSAADVGLTSASRNRAAIVRGRREACAAVFHRQYGSLFVRETGERPGAGLRRQC